MSRKKEDSWLDTLIVVVEVTIVIAETINMICTAVAGDDADKNCQRYIE